MSKDDAREITDRAKVNKKKRFDKNDFATIADYVTDTLDTRKQARKDREKIWRDIDRQLAMEPDRQHKMDATGRPDPDKNWMPELELPLQAQTLEMLTADARRMLFPSTGPWYQAHVALTDDFLRKVDFQGLITGDENDTPSQINQDNADKMVAGVLDHWHRQYDFFGNVDNINAEAFKYGMGIGRARSVSKRVFLNTARGMVKLDEKIPMLVPVSIWETYLDDSEHRLMNEGQFVGPSTVREWTQLLSDVVMAARAGSGDPEKEEGGWMAKNLDGLDPDKNGQVQLVEMEGDIIVPRKTTSNVYLPNAIVTVVKGRKGRKAESRVIRFRFREEPFTSYIPFPYHQEHLDTPYAASPLMKGHPIQKSAVDALSRLIEASALNTQPPIRYDSDDRQFAMEGGPRVFPGALWGTVGNVDWVQIGDPTGLFNVYAGLLQQYSDVTGITAPRLGQQTVSHTTAFAKEAELNRGTIRTVDYARQTMKGPLTDWLYIAWLMGRKTFKAKSIYIDAYNGWIDLDRDQLPDMVTFEVHGASGPQEEQVAEQQRLQAMQTALQLDQLNVQQGREPTVDLSSAIEQILRRGGWTDVDTMLSAQQQVSGDIPGAQLGVLAGNPQGEV